MNLNKPPKAALSTLVRRGLKNRYDFTRVTIDGAGNVTGHMDVLDRYGRIIGVTPFGNLTMWSWKRTESMGIHLVFQKDPAIPGTIIFKFAPDT